jgi:hypothetical protein
MTDDEEQKALARLEKGGFVKRTPRPKRPYFATADHEARLGIAQLSGVDGDPQGREVARPYADSKLIVYERGKRTKEIPIAFDMKGRSLSLSPSTQRVVLSEWNRLHQIDLETGKEIATWAPAEHIAGDLHFGHLDDDRFLAFDSRQERILLIARREPKGPLEIVAEAGEADGHSFDAYGGWAFVHDSKGRLRVYGEQDGVFQHLAKLVFPKHTLFRIYCEEGQALIEAMDVLFEVVGPQKKTKKKK